MGIGIRESGDDDTGEVSEINVTPFIDVVLVLLIIFMVAAPLSTVDVAVDLPASNAAPRERPSEPIFLTLKADLSLSLGEDDVSRDAVAAALEARTKGDHEERIFLRADAGVAYGELMEVMNLLRDAGYLKIGLVGLEAATVAPPAPAQPLAPAAPAALPPGPAQP